MGKGPRKVISNGQGSNPSLSPSAKPIKSGSGSESSSEVARIEAKIDSQYIAQKPKQSMAGMA